MNVAPCDEVRVLHRLAEEVESLWDSGFQRGKWLEASKIFDKYCSVFLLRVMRLEALRCIHQGPESRELTYLFAARGRIAEKVVLLQPSLQCRKIP